jgi:prepilin-type N-terminal cleavage/methylation domain-containing protein
MALPNRTTHRHAFTLVELAVVLTIIGLLVGGIMGGLSLERVSQVRGVLSDVTSYAIAVQHFQDKYRSLPGDMPDAERVWGNAEGAGVNTNCATPTTSASVGVTTCNGNGNGVIEASGAENFRAWQQLTAAGLIGGSYPGIPGGGGNTDAQPGVNIPNGSIDNTGFYFISRGIAGDFGDTTTSYDNALIFGAAVAGNLPNGPALTTAEAQSIDAKADDGLPASGSIRPYDSTNDPNSDMNHNHCATSSTSTATYNLSITTPLCTIFFLNTFKAKPQ